MNSKTEEQTVALFSNILFICSMLMGLALKISGQVEDFFYLMQPATVKKWHNTAFRYFWRWKSRRRGGRPPISKEMQIKTVSGSSTYEAFLTLLSWRTSTKLTSRVKSASGCFCKPASLAVRARSNRLRRMPT